MRRIIVLLLICQPLWADKLQTAALWTTESWQATLQHQLLQQWTDISGDAHGNRVSLVGLSPDYQLPACSQALNIELARPLQPGRNGVELRCASPWWQQFVAVELHVMESVAILTQAARSGDSTASASIQFVQQDLGNLQQGYIRNPEQLQDMEFRRNLRPGTVITPDMLISKLLIERGALVRIHLQRGAIQLQTEGDALSQGRKGDTIRVRNRRSGKTLTAEVIGPGEVTIR
ncbi:flagellar basal body P-ring formation chaperone FlgA [Candidatus Thalassolituus haligoni]|uniref:flagellar basal body P-ring formation chaperone FlgA n=1 Tax=Candidatus Thalassolituus haligoni TaxID=3100113 RepID=UPI003516EFE1